jgi:starvation-inducible DNA-binding protein
MLKEILKKLLASEYAFVIKAQFFHWNVEGPDFVQLHQLFNMIYDDVYGAIDPTAEYIRTLDDYAPGSFERFAELSEISGQTRVPRARLMIEELLSDSEKMIALLNQCFDAAESEDQQGIANFIAERIDAHGKWRWQLRSCVRDQRA